MLEHCFTLHILACNLCTPAPKSNDAHEIILLLAGNATHHHYTPMLTYRFQANFIESDIQ